MHALLDRFLVETTDKNDRWYILAELNTNHGGYPAALSYAKKHHAMFPGNPVRVRDGKGSTLHTRIIIES